MAYESRNLYLLYLVLCSFDSVPTVMPTPAMTPTVTPKPAAKSASFSNYSNAILAVLVSMVFSLSTVIYYI